MFRRRVIPKSNPAIRTVNWCLLAFPKPDSRSQVCLERQTPVTLVFIVLPSLVIEVRTVRTSFTPCKNEVSRVLALMRLADTASNGIVSTGGCRIVLGGAATRRVGGGAG